MAEQQMKQTGNFRRYKQVFADNPVHDLTYDTAWVEQSEAAALQSMETLEGRLSAAQAHLNKEAIRTAYLAIAEFASEKGDLDGAMRAVLRSREYCTNRIQTAQVCLLIMELAMDLRE